MAIEKGDWVVAGETADGLDLGQIISIPEDASPNVRVAWQSGDTTDLDITPDHVCIYGRRRAAEAEYERRVGKAADPEDAGVDAEGDCIECGRPADGSSGHGSGCASCAVRSR